MIRKFFRENLEVVTWTSALIWLAISDPTAGAHFTLCPLRILGIEICPGCGLGRAVSSVLHGDLAGSFHYHLLGVPAIVILVARLASLTMSGWSGSTTDKSTHNPSKEPVCPTSCN